MFITDNYSHVNSSSYASCNSCTWFTWLNESVTNTRLLCLHFKCRHLEKHNLTWERTCKANCRNEVLFLSFHNKFPTPQTPLEVIKSEEIHEEKKK